MKAAIATGLLLVSAGVITAQHTENAPRKEPHCIWVEECSSLNPNYCWMVKRCSNNW